MPLMVSEPSQCYSVTCRECDERIYFPDDGITIYYSPVRKLHFHRGECFELFQLAIAEIDGSKRKRPQQTY